jgi:hypothetical protein
MKFKYPLDEMLKNISQVAEEMGMSTEETIQFLEDCGDFSENEKEELLDLLAVT